MPQRPEQRSQRCVTHFRSSIPANARAGPIFELKSEPNYQSTHPWMRDFIEIIIGPRANKRTYSTLQMDQNKLRNQTYTEIDQTERTDEENSRRRRGMMRLRTSR
jgi:hypothetical protein